MLYAAIVQQNLRSAPNPVKHLGYGARIREGKQITGRRAGGYPAFGQVA